MKKTSQIMQKKSSARKTRTTLKKAQVKVELFLKWK